MSETHKPILCLDFDGVIHSYNSGWQGAAIIPDPPVPGAIEFIYNALDHFRVAIFSSRSLQPGGLDAMRGWLAMFVRIAIDNQKDAERVLNAVEWPTEKPPAFVTIDDRAITFSGAWPDIDFLKRFQPWNKKPPIQSMCQATTDENGDWVCSLCEFRSAKEDEFWCRLPKIVEPYPSRDYGISALRAG